MKASTELHQLIQSMSMSEKRHFKIHSSRHVIGKGNNYLKLFDAVASQKQYNEEKIREQFSGNSFIRHLPSEKHYLYDHVLEGLNSFHKEKTFLSRHANTLISIELLYNRGLFAQCSKLISRAKKEAYSLEKFSVLLIILRWETLIHIKNEDDRNLNRNIAEELRVLEMMRIQYVLMQIAFNVQVQIDKNRVSPGFIRESENKLKKNLPNDPGSDSFWAKYYYHSTMGLIASVQEKQMLRYQSYKEIKRLMDVSPQFIIDLPGIYHLNTNNLVSMMFLLKKYTEAETLIRHQRLFMDHYKIKRPALSQIIFLNTNENELFLLYKTGRYEKGSALVKKIEGHVKKIEPGFSPLLFDLLFMMAITELKAGSHKEAARWLNRILNAERVAGFRKELQVNTRLLYLVLMFEMNDRLLENRMDSTRRFLQKEPQFKAQALLLEIMRIFHDDAGSKRKKDKVKKLLGGVRTEFKRSGEAGLYKQFDFAGWVEEQLKG